mmetsp:Transcript_26643/g.48834  ORF Transcript_26643/g.48834 Transcript_26643/m.48834 type:complete len:170 (-) Transcript_26643:66-575(-)
MTIFGRPATRSSGRTQTKKGKSGQKLKDYAWHEEDGVKGYVSAANMFFALGTHRTAQFKESQRTPGPGAYRTQSIFPSPAQHEVALHPSRRPPSWPLTSRFRSRVSDFGPAYTVVPPIVNNFRRVHEGLEPSPTARYKLTVGNMPPLDVTGAIRKGHSGDVPKGDGMPL